MPPDYDAMIAELQAMKAAQSTTQPAPTAAPAPQPAPAITEDTLAAAIAKAMATQQQPTPAPHTAVAPSAPAGNPHPTVAGMVDIFGMSRASLEAAGGPEFVRQHLERAWRIGNNNMPRPKIPGKK